MGLEQDILDHISDRYDKNQLMIVIHQLDNIQQEQINVGKMQLIRAILTIADGDLKVIKTIIEGRFYGDPRDVIMEGIEKGLHNSGMSRFK